MSTKAASCLPQIRTVAESGRIVRYRFAYGLNTHIACGAIVVACTLRKFIAPQIIEVATSGGAAIAITPEQPQIARTVSPGNAAIARARHIGSIRHAFCAVDASLINRI